MSNFLLQGLMSTYDKATQSTVTPAVLAAAKVTPQPLRSKFYNRPISALDILVIDDDLTFGKIIGRHIEKSGSSMTYCSSPAELSNVGGHHFDVAIVDYDLGSVTGCELTSYIEGHAFGGMPVILVSQTKRTSGPSWPRTIHSFVHKTAGPAAVLQAAFGAVRGG